MSPPSGSWWSSWSAAFGASALDHARDELGLRFDMVDGRGQRAPLYDGAEGKGSWQRGGGGGAEARARWSAWGVGGASPQEDRDAPAGGRSGWGGAWGGGGGWERRAEPWDEDAFEQPLPSMWRSGDSLCFDVPMTPEGELGTDAPPVSQWWDVDRVAESANFVAVAKPSSMAVWADQRGLWDSTPMNFVHAVHRRFDLPTAKERGHRGLCHRLDSFSSGVQIFGTSCEAVRHFAAENAAHRVKKDYIVLVDGRLGGEEGPHEGVVEVPLKKWQDFGRREFGSVVCAREGSSSVTKYRVLRHFHVRGEGTLKYWGRDRWFSLVHLHALTGCTDQVRVHMAFLGHPLVSDVRYHAKANEDDFAIAPRIFYHCLRIEFQDMDSSTFTALADLAPDLQAALRRLQSLAVNAAAPAAPALHASGSEDQGTADPADGAGSPAAPPAVPALSSAEPGQAIEGAGAGAAAGAKVAAGTGVFVGLAGLLRRSIALRPIQALAAKGPTTEVEEKGQREQPRDEHRQLEGAGEVPMAVAPSQPAQFELRLSSRCAFCQQDEASRRSTLRRGDRAAMHWRLEAHRGAAASTAAVPEAEATSWGPSAVWTPTELVLGRGGPAAFRPMGLPPPKRTWFGDDVVEDLPEASPEALGAHWGPRGAEWTWAHDGVRRNGWIRLGSDGRLMTKWGPGSWALLPSTGSGASPAIADNDLPPLLLATFNDVEHALRLELESHDGGPLGFAVVAKRRLTQERSLADEDPASLDLQRAFDSKSPSTFPTRGWPSENPPGGRRKPAAE